MTTYSDDHRLIGHEFTIHSERPTQRLWSHGRCVRVTLSSAEPGAKVTHILLRFPDGGERAYRPFELRRTVIGYPVPRR